MVLSYSILGELDEVRETTLTSIDSGLTTLSGGSYKNTSSTGSASSGTSTDKTVYYYGKALIDNSDGHLRIGMAARTEIVVARAESVLLIPLLAMGTMSREEKACRSLMRAARLKRVSSPRE